MILLFIAGFMKKQYFQNVEDLWDQRDSEQVLQS